MNRRRHGMRLAIVVVVAAWSVTALVAHCWLPQVNRQSTSALAAAPTSFASMVDMHHVGCPPDIAGVPPALADTTTFAAIPAAAVSTIAAMPAYPYHQAGRGPPGSSGKPPSGQDLLIRYCLARR
ncbi:hypothetical protein [Mycobacterium asiaticum]|uniref:hypothetical protein n=1 Tax=Mycobacterium asiaticum TaxID=1790 RepID=UPI000ACED5F2|nr:hypothetical protein [Mycobacterium asiaticum]